MAAVGVREVRRRTLEADAAARRIGPRFRRPELRGRAGQYLRGLISRAERKNGWRLAEEVGGSRPTNLQHFIARARRDAGTVRDGPRACTVARLGDPKAADESALIADETGFPKKKTESVGVKRMDSGTAGRIHNRRIGVFPAPRTPRGHAPIDRAPYLPQERVDGTDRRAEAKVPAEADSATEPALAGATIGRAPDAGVPCGRVAADAVRGGDSRFREPLEDRGIGYAVAAPKARRVWAPGFRRVRAGDNVRELAGDSGDSGGDSGGEHREEPSCGAGTKGQRRSRRAAIRFGVPPEQERGRTFRKASPAREGLGESEKGVRERTHDLTRPPEGATLQKPAEIAGARRATEECRERAEQETGPDEYEVRSRAGRRRHVTPSMLAHATPAAIRAEVADAATEPAAAPEKRTRRTRESTTT